MQVNDRFINVALCLENAQEGNALLGAIARYLRSGEEPTQMSATQKIAWVALRKDIETSRARIMAGSSTEQHCHGQREPITPRTRYEVFERDGYTCQYCGAKASDVELHVDHIVPVSKGGGNGLDNLVTACATCNLGKSDLATTRFDGEDDD